MKITPLFVLGCLLTWSAISLPLRAQDDGAILFISTGNGSTGGNGLEFYTGGITFSAGGSISSGVALTRGLSSIGDTSGATLTLDLGSILYSGNPLLNSGGITIVSSGGGLTLGGTIGLNSGITNATNTGGILTLTGGNSFTGTTTVTGGTLLFNSGAGVISGTGGVLQISNPGILTSSGSAVTLANNVTNLSSPLLVNNAAAQSPTSGSNGVILNPQVAPEPSSLGLLLCGLALFSRRSRKK